MPKEVQNSVQCMIADQVQRKDAWYHYSEIVERLSVERAQR